jgi:hypothetical protein
MQRAESMSCRLRPIRCSTPRRISMQGAWTWPFRRWNYWHARKNELGVEKNLDWICLQPLSSLLESCTINHPCRSYTLELSVVWRWWNCETSGRNGTWRTGMRCHVDELRLGIMSHKSIDSTSEMSEPHIRTKYLRTKHSCCICDTIWGLLQRIVLELAQSKRKTVSVSSQLHRIDFAGKQNIC